MNLKLRHKFRASWFNQIDNDADNSFIIGGCVMDEEIYDSSIALSRATGRSILDCHNEVVVQHVLKSTKETISELMRYYNLFGFEQVTGAINRKLGEFNIQPSIREIDKISSDMLNNLNLPSELYFVQDVIYYITELLTQYTRPKKTTYSIVDKTNVGNLFVLLRSALQIMGELMKTYPSLINTVIRFLLDSHYGKMLFGDLATTHVLFQLRPFDINLPFVLSMRDGEIKWIFHRYYLVENDFSSVKL